MIRRLAQNALQSGATASLQNLLVDGIHPWVCRAACNAAVGQAAQSSRKRSWSSAAGSSEESISVTFHDQKDGSVKSVQVPLGQSLLEAAHSNDIDLEGACEGSLACSTCHVILEDPDMYDKLEEPNDDENDMLDLAFGLTDTSRLGCQVIATKELDGLKVRIPGATRNFAVDGYVPKPH